MPLLVHPKDSQEMRGNRAQPLLPPPSQSTEDSLANVAGQALQRHVVQGQVAQAAQLSEALRESAPKPEGGQ